MQNNHYKILVYFLYCSKILWQTKNRYFGGMGPIHEKTMQQNPIVSAAQAHVTSLLRPLDSSHPYHNLAHTQGVYETALEIGQARGLSSVNLELLALAAMFHDTGFLDQYEGHEYASQQRVRAFLAARDYPAERIEQVATLIDCTRQKRIPDTELAKILVDADLSSLGKAGYMDRLKRLRQEWANYLGLVYSDEDWWQLNIDFLKAHEFYTEEASDKYSKAVKENRSALKKLAKTFRKAPSTVLDTSKSAQMMFKTSLRNHLDLSNLADNKANIMLSVNALIITVAMPVAASYISASPFLALPIGVLILTCLLSMLFATLATRPIKMSGETKLTQVDQGQSNLFFFGNFYKMSLKDYRQGIKTVLANSSFLEESVMRDLYFLGQSLGKKYHQLRICYNIFMVGITLSVALYALMTYLNKV